MAPSVPRDYLEAIPGGVDFPYGTRHTSADQLTFSIRQRERHMEERVVLVDAGDREIGTEEKMEAHRRGLLHRAISVFVFRPDGSLLLQRRAWEKYHSGGLWTNTCCTKSRPGEFFAASYRRSFS